MECRPGQCCEKPPPPKPAAPLAPPRANLHKPPAHQPNAPRPIKPPHYYDRTDEVTLTDSRPHKNPDDGPSTPTVFLLVLLIPLLIAAIATPVVINLVRNR